MKNKPGAEPLAFKARDQWRSWLEQNHNWEGEAWLVIYKAKYKEQGLTLGDAVEEALCFGWIDGVLHPLDDRRYTLRFSPRTSGSTWSLSNIRRTERLLAEGKMTEAGKQKILEAMESGEWQAAIQRQNVDFLPQDLENALRKRDRALAAYRALPASRKKQYLYWLEIAKRDVTRQKRIRRIVEEVLKT